MGQAKFVVAVLFTMVFTIAIVSYVSIYASDNSAAVSLADNSDFMTINSTLQTASSSFLIEANDSSAGMVKSTTEPDSDTLKSPAIFQTLGSTIRTVRSVLDLVRTQIFEDSPAFTIVISSISAFFVFLAVVYIWKTFKGGDPD